MNQLVKRDNPGMLSSDLEDVLINGDLKSLKPEQRVSYYKAVCESLGLNPLTKPFDYLSLQGRLTLYARKECTEQLRKLHNISLTVVDRSLIEGVYIISVRAVTPDGRCDESTGAVAIDALKGEARANAIMKAETKGKRRVTLSICGLGMMDETEMEYVGGARVVNVGADGEILGDAPPHSYLAEAKARTAESAPRLSQKQLLAKMSELSKELEALGDRGAAARDEARVKYSANKTYEGACDACEFMESVIAGLTGTEESSE